MGMFDTFHYTCPKCKKEANSQTKLGECAMLTLTVGCEFLQNGKITMKDPCGNCQAKNCVVIEDKIIQRFIHGEKATHKEGLWGTLEKVSKPTLLTGRTNGG